MFKVAAHDNQLLLKQTTHRTPFNTRKDRDVYQRLTNTVLFHTKFNTQQPLITKTEDDY